MRRLAFALGAICHTESEPVVGFWGRLNQTRRGAVLRISQAPPFADICVGWTCLAVGRCQLVGVWCVEALASWRGAMVESRHPPL